MAHHSHHQLMQRHHSRRRGGGYHSGVGFGKNLPGLDELGKYVVNGVAWEGIGNTLYDSAAYPAAGVNQLQFFLLPQGQGTGSGGIAKSLSDTNMQAAGQLPAENMFLVSSIEVDFYPATPTPAGGNANHLPASAPVATGQATQVNDVYIFRRSGNLVFKVMSKNYVEEAPLMKFPPRAYLKIDAAISDTTTAGATGMTRVAFAHAQGPTYKIPPILLKPNTFFSVILQWPEGLQVITDPARVFVVLNGALYRRSQ